MLLTSRPAGQHSRRAAAQLGALLLASTLPVGCGRGSPESPVGDAESRAATSQGADPAPRPADPASPAEATRAALAEMAEAILIVEDDRGGYLGARFVASLEVAPSGKPLVRIYAYDPSSAGAANVMVDQAVCQNLLGAHFLFEATRAVRPELRRELLVAFRDQFDDFEFELTEDPAQANVYAFETTFVPNPVHPRPLARDNRHSAFTLAAGSEPPVSIITLNTGGQNDLAQAVERGDTTRMRATFLNEMMNALGTRDLQDVDTSKLTRATQIWGARLERDHGAAALDRYTITHSHREMTSDGIGEMDRMVVARILEEAAKLRRNPPQADGEPRPPDGRE